MAGRNIAKWETHIEIQGERRQSRGDTMKSPEEKDARALPVTHGPRGHTYINGNRLVYM